MARMDTDRELTRIRAGIDQTDDALVALLARRRTLALELAKIKKVVGLPIYDRKREAALLERVKALGARSGVDEEFAEVLFRLIMMNSKEVQQRASE